MVFLKYLRYYYCMGLKRIIFLLVIHIFTFACAFNAFAAGISEQPASQENVWFVSGDGAAVAGNDLNPGTAEQPLASVQKALTLIKAAYAGESFKTAVIRIDGKVSNTGNDYQVLGMITIQGEGAYPAIVLRGSSNPIRMDTLNAGGNGRVLYIEDGNNVTIENLTLTGGRASTGAGVYVCGSRFTVGRNSFVQGNEGGFGGGICVDDGILVIRGSVADNKADNGGGAALRGNSVIEIYGTISGNYALYSGGGLLLDGAQGIIKSGFIISNTAHRGAGGGIFLKNEESVLIVDNASISGNKAENGGGIFASDGAGIRINSCIMQNNDARAGGAAALLNSSIALHDADVRSNTAINGGGFLIVAGFMSMSGGFIQNNSVTGSGGGIFAGIVNEIPAEILMSGGVIKDNEADHSGGGICMTGGHLILSSDALVSANRSSAPDYPGGGGGIYAVNSTFTMKGQSAVRANHAVRGAGIYLNGEHINFHFESGVVEENIAKEDGGGIYATVKNNMNISENAHIEGNTAKNGNELFVIDNNHP